ncbi:hypothetical protein [Methylobacterium sp. 37f]|uniref:beta strand repeat-containing protein n=1 Tax=Methylobacterium sp. 37f TaxID=2817058 RepID=UPI001FFDADB9|nr:hypothetical protein [Methylobacterium sp. 37f]MCK2055256.1 hypothetical protein [Methylobacterium sp. 37f]
MTVANRDFRCALLTTTALVGIIVVGGLSPLPLVGATYAMAAGGVGGGPVGGSGGTDSPRNNGQPGGAGGTVGSGGGGGGAGIVGGVGGAGGNGAAAGAPGAAAGDGGGGGTGGVHGPVVTTSAGPGVAGLGSNGGAGGAGNGTGSGGGGGAGGYGVVLDQTGGVVTIGTSAGGNGGNGGVAGGGAGSTAGNGGSGGIGVFAGTGNTINLVGAVSGGNGGTGAVGGAGIVGSGLTLNMGMGATVTGGIGAGGRANALTLDGASTVIFNNTTTSGSGLSGPIAIGSGGNLEFNQANAAFTDYADVITGAGSVSKTGAGGVRLGGVNTYTGRTTVSDGLLVVFGAVQGGVTNNSGSNNLGSNVGFIADGGTINGGLINNGDAIASNNAVINGGLINSGRFSADNSAVNGAITNAAGGIFSADNTLTSDSTFGNAAGANLNVNSGTYTVAGLITNAGTAAVANGATLQANGGFNNQNALTNNGTLNGVLNNSGTATNTGTVGGPLINSGTYTQTAGATNGGTTNTGTVNAGGGTFNGAIANNAGAFNITGPGPVTSDSTFGNAAGANLNVNSGTYTVAGLITNSGAATVASGAALVANGGFTNASGGTLNNGGTLTSASPVQNQAGATGTNTDTLNGGLNNAGTFGNSGTVNGELTNSGTYTQTAGATNGVTTNTGTVNAQGGTFGGPIVNNAPSVFRVGASNSVVVVNNSFTNNNGATFIVAGSLTGITTLTNNSAGTLANAPGVQVLGTGTLGTATILNTANGVFNSAGATTASTSITNIGSFLITGGAVTTPLFSNNSLLTQTGGTLAATQLTNAGTYTFQNGTLNANTVTNTASGTIAVSGGQFAANRTAGSSITNGGSFSLTGGTVTSPLLANNNLFNQTGGTLAATQLTNAGTYTFQNGVVSTATVNNSGTFVSGGAFSATDSVVNTGNFRLAGGTFTTPRFDNNGAVRVEGIINASALGGSITSYNNNGTTTLANLSMLGGVGTFTNSGTLNVDRNGVPASGFGTYQIQAGTLVNQGLISLQNGVVTDTLALTGNYAAGPNAKLAIDVDLTRSDAGQRGDLLRVTGTNTGNTQLALQFVRSGGSNVFFSTPIPVLVAAGSSGTVQLETANALESQRVGFINYSLQQAPGSPGSYQIVSLINPGQASATAAGITSLVSALNIGFFQSISALIGGPAENRLCTDEQRAAKLCGETTSSVGVTSNGKTWAQLNQQAAAAPVAATANESGILPNTYGLGLWARGSGGETNVKSTSTATFTSIGQTATAENSTRINFAGMQFGGDIAVFNMANTGFNAHLGVTGGEIYANGRQQGSSLASGVFNVPFVGAYLAVTSGPFTSDISYRHDFFNARISDPVLSLSGTRLPIASDTVGGSLGYRIDFASPFGGDQPYFFEPSTSMSYTKTRIGDLAVPGGTLAIDSIDSILGRVGFRVGTTLTAGDTFALQPFVTASLWNEFAGNAASRFIASSAGTFDPNATVPILTNRVGMFGQVGVGVSGALLGTDLIGYVRGDVRFGERLDGYSLNGGVRYPF